ncbi:MAG: ABC transporter permease [Hyphomicrobiales bacterium]|nr:ABC transporter permease [Hyphomicrobiales bacterium]
MASTHCAMAANDPAIARAWSWFILPVVVFLTLFFLLPVINLVELSLRPHAGPGAVGDGLTLANYTRFLTDPFYLGVLFDTMAIGLVVVSICLVLAYPIAYVLARTKSRFRGALLFIVIAPLLISTVVRNLGWFPILGGSGLINWALMSLGIISEPIRLMNNTTGVIIALTHTFLPFMILALVTVIQKIGVELEEAARNLGAGPIETFFRVILPLSRPGLLAGYLIVFTSVISAFTTPAMMGGRRVLVMSTLIEQQMRSVLNYPVAATAAILLMVMAAALTIASLRQRGDARP